jgi:hypothetical protein
MAAKLLDAGIQRDSRQLDEKLYLKVCAESATPERGRSRSAAQR